MDFDFLFIIGGILYFLYRLFGGGKENTNDRETPRTIARASEKKSLRERVEVAIQNIESGIQPSSTSDQTKLEQAPQPTDLVKAKDITDDPFAFHSASAQFVKAESEPAIKPIDWSEYHTLADENNADEYHPHSFSGFQMAHGISHAGEHTEDDIHVDIYDIQEGNVQHHLFTSPDDIRRAVITHEILGKPKALQRR